jgi:hypothetical protein
MRVYKGVEKVTITGADDGVSAADLSRLSRLFPFVEWAILVSSSREGTARYPNRRWIFEDLAFVAAAHERELGRPMNLAIHVCGSVSRQVQSGDMSILLPYVLMGAQRFQINGFELKYLDVLERARVESPLMVKGFDRDRDGEPDDVQFILQARDALQLDAARLATEKAPVGSTSILYDASGGRGISPVLVRVIDRLGVTVGLAGGINPENVFDQLQRAEDCGYSWIDMESGVRTSDDRFDFAKVLAVLETSRGFFTRSNARFAWSDWTEKDFEDLEAEIGSCWVTVAGQVRPR